jgi:hypothetical protein
MNISRRGFLAGSMGIAGVPSLIPAPTQPALQAQEASGELHYLSIRDAAARIRSRRLRRSS